MTVVASFWLCPESAAVVAVQRLMSFYPETFVAVAGLWFVVACAFAVGFLCGSLLKGAR